MDTSLQLEQNKELKFLWFYKHKLNQSFLWIVNKFILFNILKVDLK